MVKNADGVWVGETKGESIRYAIRKGLLSTINDIDDWCKSWKFTREEFERFLELGARAFDEKSTKKVNTR